jgi:hypothetical protein
MIFEYSLAALVLGELLLIYGLLRSERPGLDNPISVRRHCP